MDDEQLFELCRERDARAWETLVRRHQDRVLGLAYQFCGERDEARDLAQEIFVRLYQTMDRYESGRSFRTWLMTLARNLCIDRYRRKRAQRQHRSLPLEEIHHLAGEDEPADVRLVRHERENLLHQALDHLGAPSREAIVMKDLQHHSVEEMAEMLAVPVGTVKSRLSRARVELGKAILKLERTGGRSTSDAL